MWFIAYYDCVIKGSGNLCGIKHLFSNTILLKEFAYQTRASAKAYIRRSRADGAYSVIDLDGLKRLAIIQTLTS